MKTRAWNEYQFTVAIKCMLYFYKSSVVFLLSIIDLLNFSTIFRSESQRSFCRSLVGDGHNKNRNQSTRDIFSDRKGNTCESIGHTLLLSL